MTRIVIDTNILYSIVDLSKNEKVVNSCIEDYKLSITTSSLIEMIVKNQNNLSNIKKCIKPIISERIELISIGHAPISNEYLYKLHHANDIEEVKCIIGDIKTLKISREAEFYRFILLLVIPGLFEVVREDGYKFDDEFKNQEQLKLTKSLLESNMEFFLDSFEQAIRQGYNDGNEQQAALNAFQTIIASLLEAFHKNYHMIKTDTVNINENETNEILQSSLKDDDFNKKFKRYLDNPISIASKKKHHALTSGYLNEMKKGLSDTTELTDTALSFIIKKIDDAYKEERKLRKNDIFDLLIVFSLSMPDTLIVTLDKGFLKDLKDLDPNSYKMCQKLGYIS